MTKKIQTKCKGMTLIELTISIMIMSVAIIAAGSVLTGSSRDWRDVYYRVFGPIPQDLYTARETFETACRGASGKRISIGEDGSSVELYLFSAHDGTVPLPDRYQTFYLDGNDLMTEIGELTPGSWTHSNVISTRTVISRVTSVQFGSRGLTVQMHLTVADGNKTMSVVWAGIRHN